MKYFSREATQYKCAPCPDEWQSSQNIVLAIDENTVITHKSFGIFEDNESLKTVKV